MGMKLADWLITNNVSDPEFGELIDRARTTVTRLKDGTTRPDWKTAQRIFEVTKGEVTPNDFLLVSAEAAQ